MEYEPTRSELERLRSIIEWLPQGYDECELIRDADGRPIDYFIFETNASFERLLGLSRDEVRGKRVTEIISNLEAWWPTEIGKIVDGGRPGRLEHEVASFDRLYGDDLSSR
ncbi:PAS domain-containing protein [Rhodopseudomonas sp. WA056]|uniref:PAS domain-containing protein n=1 Tax=Rhodopseudomonas sp. WA056 TaxID=2269367 RepID=UPI0013E07F0F|nr:PAS domain-containing protein [Rhodopseudomonas sp. WA056]